MTTIRAGDLHELAVGADRFRAVFSALSDGVIATDRSGRISEANPAAHRLLGHGALVGARLAELLPPGRAEVLEPRDERVVRRWRMPGEEREVVLEVVTTRTLDEAGKHVGDVHTVRDISAEAALARLKEEFLFKVAHELRSPIASLTASLDILYQDSETMPSDERRSLIAALRRGSLRLEALVENLLDVGSMQAGTFEVRATIASLRRCLNDALYLARPLVQSKAQEVKLHLPRGCERIVADPRRTTQVLSNLVSNASKYAPDGTAIEIEGERTDGFVRVRVRDHGPGVPVGERERVFDRFYRSRINRDEAAGIGLGLTIARAIVEAQGGIIGIDAAPDGGAIVYFTVPCAREETSSE